MKTANTTATVNSWIFTADTVTVNGRTFPASYSLTPKGDVYAFVNLKATNEVADLPAVRLHICANMPMHAEAVAAAQAAKLARQAAKKAEPVVEAATPAAEPAPVADPAPVQDAPAPAAEPAPAKKPARKKAAKKAEPVVEAAEPAPAKKPARKKAAKKAEPIVEAAAPAAEPAPVADPAPVQDAPAPAAEPAPAKNAAAPVEKAWIGTAITGNGWAIAFDAATGRTRVTVEGTPTDAQRAAIEQAGFYWSAKMASWNKGLTCKAYRAAQALAAALTALA